MDEKSEELDYLQTKVDKLEESNKELRLSKDPKQQMKKLEAEVAYLEQQLASAKSSGSASAPREKDQGNGEQFKK